MRVLWCSDSSNLPTGYANVTRNIMEILKKANIDVRTMGFQYKGNPLDAFFMDSRLYNFPMYPTIDIREQYGENGSVEMYVNNIKPDITAFLCDSFMIKWIIEKKIRGDKIIRVIDSLKEKTKTLFYFPLDSEDVYPIAKNVIESMDIRVAMSRFGQKILKKETGMDSFYIPHAVDTNIYNIINEKHIDEFKKANNMGDKFVVGCVARNQGRKVLSKLYEAFSIFSKNKDDVILIMHCDPKDPMGEDLITISDKLGIRKKILYTGLKSFYYGMPDVHLNLLYNAMDIHAISTTGEGFGIPIIESMACGVPNILTDYTTSRELIEGCGELCKISAFIEASNTRRAIVDVNDMAKKMQKLYDKPKLREKYGKIARDRVLNHYTWDKIGRMWIELLEFGEIREKY